MDDDLSQAKRMLERIASSLQVEHSEFFGKGEVASSPVRETMELLIAFEQIVDHEDRRDCLDYVRAVAAKQSKP